MPCSPRAVFFFMNLGACRRRTPRARSERRVASERSSVGRVFGLPPDRPRGPRRSPSACPEMSKKKVTPCSVLPERLVSPDGSLLVGEFRRFVHDQVAAAVHSRTAPPHSASATQCQHSQVGAAVHSERLRFASEALADGSMADNFACHPNCRDQASHNYTRHN